MKKNLLKKVVTSIMIVGLSLNMVAATSPLDKAALISAQNYVSITSVSKDMTIKHLKYEGYSKSNIDYAMKNLKVNWNYEAVSLALKLKNMPNVKKSEVEKKLYEAGFSTSEVKYATIMVTFRN